MRVHGDVKPSEWTAESCPNKPGTALVRFCLNPVEETVGERTGWVYDEFTVEVPDGEDLQERVAVQKETLLYEAKANQMSKVTILKESEALRAENKLLKEQVSALSTQADFHEECIVEMANIVYA